MYHGGQWRDGCVSSRRAAARRWYWRLVRPSVTRRSCREDSETAFRLELHDLKIENWGRGRQPWTPAFSEKYQIAHELGVSRGMKALIAIDALLGSLVLTD